MEAVRVLRLRAFWQIATSTGHAGIYEVDPLTCPRCGHELTVVAALTDPRVIDHILEHRRRADLRSPFEPRAPPAA